MLNTCAIKKTLLIVIMALMGCSSVHLVENWKNPDIVIFSADKVLLVGMPQNEKTRINFEGSLKKEFDIRGVEAMRSIDLFDVDFTNSARTEKELDEVEQQLLDKDFDAILFTKIIGSENRKKFNRALADFNGHSDGFKKDYLEHQDIHYDKGYYENFNVYHAETSLYCICEGKKRALIWRGGINITDPIDITKTVDDYVKLVLSELTEQDLIFRKERKSEVTGH